MARKSVLTLLAVIAVVGLAGVGFSALTATVTVTGAVTAASVVLQISAEQGAGCSYDNTGAAAPGSVSFSGLNAAQTSITMDVNGMVLGSACFAALQVENTGQAPVALTAGILFEGLNGLCYAGQVSCYDVFTLSGVQTSGLNCFHGSPTPCGTSAEISTNFTVLNPGQTFTDSLGVELNAAADPSTPSTAAFEILYIADEV